MKFLIQKYFYLFNIHFSFLEKQSKNVSTVGSPMISINYSRKKTDFIKNKSLANEKKYNTARNWYFCQVSIEKKNFYLNLFDKHKNNIKKTWININLLLGKKTGHSHCKSMTMNKVELTDPLDYANHFNDYFVSVAKKLVKKFQKQMTTS